LAVRITRDDHVKAVRPEIDSREDVGDRAGGICGVGLLGRSGRDSWAHSLPVRP
jgi:hypothetical protein